jgi:acetate kinase
MSAAAVEDLLFRQSGVLGISGLSSDFRELEASEDSRARFALEVFCYQTIRYIGSLAAALGGLDGLVFTGGVGENSAAVRAAICQGCRWLGLHLDEASNQRHGPRISAVGSRIAAYVIRTDENIVIARHTRVVCQA